MSLHSRWGLALATSLTMLVASATSASAQVVPGIPTGFEASEGYVTGTLQFQGDWSGGADPVQFPRVQTEAEIAAELTTAGLNPEGAVHSGSQALMVTKGGPITESSGYFVRTPFTGLEGKQNVIVDFWARPLTTGAGGNPNGSPGGTNTTIGERQGNIFIGVMDNAEVRAAAVRFDVDTIPNLPEPEPPYQPVEPNIATRSIDWGSASAGSAVWVPSGILWEPDQWYNIKFDMDYVAKTYDLFVNDVKANADPIRFYNEASVDATRFFISRGTNQAGALLDDVQIYEKVPVTLTADYDDDGDVDGEDFLIWQRDPSLGPLADWTSQFGQTDATPAAGSVPEPAGAVVMIGLLAGLARRRRS